MRNNKKKYVESSSGPHHAHYIFGQLEPVLILYWTVGPCAYIKEYFVIHKDFL